MAKTRVVKQGEHVPQLAAAEGFGDFKRVWDDPANAQLKQIRDPCVLNPGDELFIPEKQLKTVQLQTGKRHSFIVRRPAIRLRLALRDAADQPLANVPCRLRYGATTVDLTLDEKGEIDREIPVDTPSCTLTLPDREVDLLVGHLDPVEEPAGQRERLRNLGYDIGLSDGDEDKDWFQSAVRDFQCEHQLTVDGKCEEETQAKLKEAHGC